MSGSMTPEDVLLEAISAASLRGDTPQLRELECRKLRESIKKWGTLLYGERDDGLACD